MPDPVSSHGNFRESSSGTPLIVSESQETVQPQGGKVVCPFCPGRHVSSPAYGPGLISIVKTVTEESPFFRRNLVYPESAQARYSVEDRRTDAA
jgi:hypothetical protein